MAVNLLWADDDCEEMLKPLGKILERRGFDLTKATNYEGAKDKLRGGGIQSALLDIILPHATGISGAMAPDLGLALADHMAGSGVTIIAFLTVTRQDDVLEKYEDLKTRHPAVKFNYFDKTKLLERGVINRMVEFLLTSGQKTSG